MYKFKLFLILAFVSIASATKAQEQDKDVMIKNIVSVFKNNDKQGFLKLFPNAEIMREFVKKLMSQDGKEGEGMDAMMEGLMEKLTDSSLNEQYSDAFDKAIKDGQAKGIDWKKINLVSYTADSSVNTEELLNFKKLGGKIYFNVDTTQYFMGYDNIIWFENKGWYGISVERIDLKSKENEEEEFSIEEFMDSTVSEPDTMMIAIPPAADTIEKAPAKPVKKATTPKPATKPVKSKTPTPARKPQ